MCLLNCGFRSTKKRRGHRPKLLLRKAKHNSHPQSAPIGDDFLHLMNILWIYDRPLNPEAGGTERITSLVAKGLEKRKYGCLGMLVFDKNGKIAYGQDEVTDLYTFLKEHAVDVIINQIAYSEWLLRMFLDSGGSKWRMEGGKIISCLHFDPHNPSLLYLLKCKPNKRLKDWLQTVKAFVFRKYYEIKQQKQEGAVYNYIYDNSSWLVTLSQTHFPYLEKVMGRHDYSRLTAINNPLTFEDISLPDVIGSKKKVVLVCARMSEYHKRISLVLKAWKAIKKKDKTYSYSGWTLKLVGEGPDLQYYKNYVKINDIPDIIFVGQQSPEPFYEEASILLLTSSAEGWGLTLTEGLQRGVVPVVMDSCPVFSEIIENGSNGYLTPDNNLKAFIQKIECLMSDPDLLRKMQLAALSSADRFSIESTMDKWERILRK